MNKSLVWAGVALVGIVAAISLGLSFAGWSEQAIVGWTVGIGTFAGTVFTLLLRVESKTNGQTVTLDEIQETVQTVERRTNGELDRRIARAMEDAAETGSARAIAALRESGHIS